MPGRGARECGGPGDQQGGGGGSSSQGTCELEWFLGHALQRGPEMLLCITPSRAVSDGGCGLTWRRAACMCACEGERRDG
eukprot:2011500-Rhodomonas_salina.1